MKRRVFGLLLRRYNSSANKLDVIRTYKHLLRCGPYVFTSKEMQGFDDMRVKWREDIRAGKDLTPALSRFKLKLGDRRFRHITSKGNHGKEQIIRHFVFREDGESFERKAAKIDTKQYHDMHVVDGDSLARHNYLLRRQHFLEKPPPEVFEKDL
eukprot:TRINITY_DN20813_c0_g1_i1.p1 TRINITY_DN20813_c0_g1~~TRINITY_DN20813_c0_g1_i1.p1  ORF type:complete len:154 (+),score=22.29 TRINITY_DN20813_c0_g1_i1:167-628(+)